MRISYFKSFTHFIDEADHDWRCWIVEVMHDVTDMNVGFKTGEEVEEDTEHWVIQALPKQWEMT